MNNGITSVAVGIAAVAAVGTAAYMMNQPKNNKKMRRFKKDAQKTLRTVEGVIEGVSSMVG